MNLADPDLQDAVEQAVYARLADEARGRFNDIDPLLLLALEQGGYLMNHGAILGAWNNVPGRTHAEVLALIDAAIERQQARVANLT